MKLDIKHQLYKNCAKTVNERITRIQSALEDLKQAAAQETKSSAGDKFETQREMIQLEKNKYMQQLAEAFKLKQVLDQIHVNGLHESVQTGSVVLTSMGNFFFAISLGKVEVEGTPYFAISTASPIGKVLLGQSAGTKVSFRDKTISIKEVY